MRAALFKEVKGNEMWTYGGTRYWHRDDALQVALIANHVFS